MCATLISANNPLTTANILYFLSALLHFSEKVSIFVVQSAGLQTFDCESVSLSFDRKSGKFHKQRDRHNAIALV